MTSGQDPHHTPKASASAVTRAISWLMASSDFPKVRFEEMSISEVRELVYRIASVIITLVTIPMTLVALAHGEWALVGVNTAFIIYAAIHTYYLLTRNKRLLSPLVFLIGAVVMLVGTVAAGHDYLIYMAFTFSGSIYLFLDSRQARLTSIVLLIPAGILANRALPGGHGMYFAAALALTFLIMEFLYYILYRQENRLREQAVRDPLTNAYNRRAMIDILEHASALSSRHSTPSSIIMIDVDWFKSINDDFGHTEGDSVLVNLVETLTQRLRTNDMVCRYGGEEFIVVLVGAQAEQAVEVANEIRQILRVKPLSTRKDITVSCGIAESVPREPVLKWIERADAALYQAKSEGRDRVCQDQSMERSDSPSLVSSR